MTEIYTIISIVAFSLAGLFFLIATSLFFSYKIPKVIGDISGKEAQKEIELIRGGSTQPGKRIYTTNPVYEKPVYQPKATSAAKPAAQRPASVSSRKTTVLKTKAGGRSKRGSKKTQLLVQQANQTVVLNNQMERTGFNSDTYTGEERTELLNKPFTLDEGSLRTDILDKTSALNEYNQSTRILVDGSQETQLLPENVPPPKAGSFKIVETIVMLHTEEMIS